MSAFADYVSINSHTIRHNAKTGDDEPPIRVARSRSDPAPRYAREIEITTPCRLVYTPNSPIMKCGARLVLTAPRGSVKIIR